MDFDSIEFEDKSDGIFDHLSIKTPRVPSSKRHSIENTPKFKSS